MGDFNLSKTKWPEGNSTCNKENDFLELFHDLGLKQLISEPTHNDGNMHTRPSSMQLSRNYI